MVVVLRIDVDNGYVPIGSPIARKVKLALNWLNENYWAPHLRFLGYNESLQKLVEYLIEVGVKASVFFKYTTIPHRDLRNLMISKNFELGLHLLSAKRYEEFVSELKRVEKHLGVRILGFTKHGDGARKLSRRHNWRYEPDKYVEWGSRAGLRYFNGNEHGVATEIVKHGNFVYMPQVFYVEPRKRKVKASIDDAIEAALSNHIVVALIHPANWVRDPASRRDLEKLLSRVNELYTFKELIDLRE